MDVLFIFLLLVVIFAVSLSVLSIIDKLDSSSKMKLEILRCEERNYNDLIEKAKTTARENDILNSELKQEKEETEKLKKYYEGTISRLDQYIKNKCYMYPHLAGLCADLLLLHYDKSAQLLRTKKRPALVEASRISELRKETKIYLQELKVLKYKFAYLEALYPNINDLFDQETEVEDFELETEENTDRVRFFLSDEEYKSLSTVQKNQLALDRYISQKKSKWQIGRDFEMYIGYCLEQLKYTVEYTGIIKNLEDMGRDLIATKEKTIYVIQCKNWSKEKTIHEKHIFQLFGTVVLKQIEEPFFEVKGVFITTTSLSDEAKKVAKHLDIEIYENIEPKEFPRIKCNISQYDGERIYHLPFDQQYDKTVISTKKGECCVFTVKEAEDMGFRRALRHNYNI